MIWIPLMIMTGVAIYYRHQAKLNEAAAAMIVKAIIDDTVRVDRSGDYPIIHLDKE